jgi:hypothetical protein
MKFSERYGYVKPVEVLKRGYLDAEGITALCNCYDHLAKWFNLYDVNADGHRYDESYTELEETIWCFFMNQRRDDFYGYNSHKIAATKLKESISAVEALCREITGESTLGDALRVWEKKGVKIPTFLKSGIEKLYTYTNDKRTGIRHSLMDDTESPTFDEAKFMLVTCSAFVNYIQGKRVEQ